MRLHVGHRPKYLRRGLLCFELDDSGVRRASTHRTVVLPQVMTAVVRDLPVPLPIIPFDSLGAGYTSPNGKGFTSQEPPGP